MTGGILTAIMLVFVDVMKELPATLVIRPFNFDTLAIFVAHDLEQCFPVVRLRHCAISLAPLAVLRAFVADVEFDWRNPCRRGTSRHRAPPQLHPPPPRRHPRALLQLVIRVHRDEEM